MSDLEIKDIPEEIAPASTRATTKKTALSFIATRRIVEVVLTLGLLIAGSLLLYGANFGLDMVHSQLDAQQITFPEKGSPGFDQKEFPGLQQYAGQKVNSGPKAKAYANEYIQEHLKTANEGKTYSQLSELSRANPTDTKLQEQVASSFKGETLRWLLLYALGWSVVATIALWAEIIALVFFALMLFATLGDFLQIQESQNNTLHLKE